MPDPIRFDIKRQGSIWKLTRDDKAEGEYSHVDRATHDAVVRARELQDTGTPAQVFVQADDKSIQIDTDPEPGNPDLANNAAAFTRLTPL
ncbi:hypothetical protein [Caulobacter sp. S45]|uniref:hypothetical protein n=1 Tax=Caulobacter sp. S45 TaxID=1641861 RepID=UPI001575F933|nr:hypothetical protein [Caulobacter sp. S45]